MPIRASNSKSPPGDTDGRRNPRRGTPKPIYTDVGKNQAGDSVSSDEEASVMEEEEEDVVAPPRIKKRGKAADDEDKGGGRRSARSTKFQASLKEPNGESIRDLFQSPKDLFESPPSKKKGKTKIPKSPAASHKVARRKVKMDVQVDSEEDLSGDESGEDNGEDEDDLKISRIIAARSERRSKWKEICDGINTSEIEAGSRWFEEEKDDSGNDTFEERFLVKWDDLSYLHCSWETQEDLVQQIENAKNYLSTFFRKSVSGYLFTPDERCDGDYFDPAYTQIERVLEVEIPEQARGDNYGLIMDKRNPDYEEGTGRQFLIKWGATPYTECTYEFERDLIMNDIEYEEQVEDFFKRSKKPTKTVVKSFYAEGDREFRRLYRFFGDDSKSSEANREKEISAYQKVLSDKIYPNGGQLRDYQAEGVSWMMANYVNGRSSLLADEMGLGKTLQTCSFINLLSNQLNRRGPFLIIAPLSTLEHWKREFQTWTGLNTIIYHGSASNREQTRELEFAYEEDRPPRGGVAFNSSFLKKCHSKKKSKLEKLWMVQVVITTPEMIVTDDYSELTAIEWDALVVDEAHRLKSHSSKLATNLRDDRFVFGHTLLLTGTPIQNNMTELWALLSVIDPKSFDDVDEFLKSYGDIKSKEGVDQLHENIRPYILRRLKEDVEKSVPPKEETLIEVELTSLQKQYYRALYEKNVQFLHRNKKKALDGPSLNNLAMQLRKCCNHPFLLNGVEEEVRNLENKAGTLVSESDFLAKYSGKLVLLDKLLPRLKSNGHRVLIFSQFKIMLDILDDYLRERKFKAERIDGSITGKKRQMAIDRFQAPVVEEKESPFIMMLSTRAGGVGINLTAADTCIIFDSDWNPQNDLQAQARCHRIGQTKSVKVYRLLTRKTYEMQMFHMSSLKMGLDQAVLQGFESGGTDGENALSKDEVEKLLRHGAYDIFNEEKSGNTDAESNAFVEQDIDWILERRARKVVHENTGSKSSAAGGTFSKASFKAPKTPNKDAGESDVMDIDVDDPDFWTKMVGEAKIDDTDELSGQKRKRKTANYSEKAYARALESRLKSGNDSDSTQSDDEIDEDTYDSDDVTTGTNGSPRKRLKREFSKWGRKGSSGWRRTDAEKVNKALQVYGYGNLPWDEFRIKGDLAVYSSVEIQHMSWCIVLATLSEVAKENAAHAQRRAEKSAQRKRDKAGREEKDDMDTEDANDISGGVLAMQPGDPEGVKKLIEEQFRCLVNSNESWLSIVLRDAKAYAVINNHRDKEILERFLTSPMKINKRPPGQQNAQFAQNLWPQLKNRGWKVEQVGVGGDMTTRYLHNNAMYKSPEAVMAALPSIHPELSATVDEVQLSLANIKRREKEESVANLSLLGLATISVVSLETHLNQYAPLQLVIDRATSKHLSFTRRLLTTCSFMHNAHDIVDQAKTLISSENVVEMIANSIIPDKRMFLPQPSWNSKHDAVLILAIAKHGWVEHDACLREFGEDKSIRWGSPFDCSSETANSLDTKDGLKEDTAFEKVANRVAKFFTAERETVDSLKDLREAYLIQTYCLKKIPVSADNTMVAWEYDRTSLSNTDGMNPSTEDGRLVDLPTKKDLVKRAKAILSKRLVLSKKVTVEIAGQDKEQRFDYGYSVLDQNDVKNAFLAELLRVLIKVSFNNSVKRRALGRRLMNAAISEAKSRISDLEGSGANGLALEKMQKIKEHCAFSHKFVQTLPVQSKNVLRVVLGITPLPPKSGSNLFPVDRALALETSAKTNTDSEATESKTKERKTRSRRKRLSGASGDVAISDAMSNVSYEEKSVTKFLSEGSHVELSAVETLLLTVVCSQGLPIWTNSWYDLIDPTNLVPEKQGPGFQHAISWWGMGGVFESAANVWHHSALEKYRTASLSFQAQFSNLPDDDPSKRDAKLKLDKLERDEVRKAKSLSVASDYKENPEKLAKKCIMLLEALRRHIGPLPATEKTASYKIAKLNKSENGLGPFVLSWLKDEIFRWAESLGLLDNVTGTPLSYTAADFAPTRGNDEDLRSIAALMDKKGCRTVFAQVAQQSRVREVFLKNREEDVKSLLKVAVHQLGEEMSWEGKPAWWGNDPKIGDKSDYSIQHDYLILDSLLEYGYSGIEETLSTFNAEQGYEDTDHKLTRADIQYRANQLACGLHSLARAKNALESVGAQIARTSPQPAEGIKAFFGGAPIAATLPTIDLTDN